MASSALGRILLVSSAYAVELLVWMGICGCGCPNSLSVHRMDTAVLALMNNAPSSASAAGDVTALIICKMFNTALLLMGISSVPAINMWLPALLRAFWFRQVGRVAANCKFHVACLVSDNGIFL